MINQPFQPRRQFLATLARGGSLGLLVCGTSGCGTFLHADRRGQVHANQIDWKIVALNSLGLMLFFVPGVIAFAVDFYTGAIYLPLEESTPRYGAAKPADQFQQVSLPPDQLRLPMIEQVVSEHVGRPVKLDDDQVRVSQLAALEDFDQRLREQEFTNTNRAG